MSRRGQCIAVIGAGGFVGSHLCARLVAEGHRLHLIARDRERLKRLSVLPNTRVFELDTGDGAALRTALQGCDAAIFLPGILYERRKGDFERVHLRLARHFAESCAQAGVRRLLQMSALGADPEGPSDYLRSKGRGEAAVMAVPGLAVTALRPSVIYGPGDSFFNRFASLLRLSPLLPLAAAGARLSPVYVGDVVEAFVRTLNDPATIGRHYELCGPREYTLIELVRYCAESAGLHRPVIGLGPLLSRIQAQFLQYLPGKPLTPDNLRSLSRPSRCEHDGLAELGISPQRLESIVPGYLAPAALQSRYARLRITARR